MSPDIEYESYEAPKQAPFWSFETPEAWYDMKFLREIGTSEKFKLGDKPAKVFLIEHRGKEFRLTLTSSRLADALAFAQKNLGTFLGVPLQLMAVGDDTERTFRIRWPKGSTVQQAI